MYVKYGRELGKVHGYTCMRGQLKHLSEKSQQKPYSTKGELQHRRQRDPRKGNVSQPRLVSASRVNAMLQALAAKPTVIAAPAEVPMESHLSPQLRTQPPHIPNWPPSVQYELMHLHKQHDL